MASVARHFQKGPIPTHTEHQIIASNARELATVEAIVGHAYTIKGRLYGRQGAPVFLVAVPHGFDDRLAVALQRRKASGPLGVTIQLIIAFLVHHQRTSDLHFSRQPLHTGMERITDGTQRQHAMIQRRCKASRGQMTLWGRGLLRLTHQGHYGWVARLEAPIRTMHVEHAALEGFNSSDGARAHHPIDDERALRWLHMAVEEFLHQTDIFCAIEATMTDGGHNALHL